MIKHFHGLHGSSKAWRISAVISNYKRILVLCSNPNTASELYEELCFFLPRNQCVYYPAWDMLPLEPVSPQVHISAERIHSLWRIQSEPIVCVSPISAALQRIPYSRPLPASQITLVENAELPRQDFIDKLLRFGFKRTSLVEEIGDFAIRGGVIDLFPATLAKPIRLEFFGNTLERIRLFDPASQRTEQSVQEAVILPVREILWSPFASLSHREKEFFEARLRELADSRGVSPRKSAEVLNAFASGSELPGMEWFLPLLTEGQQEVGSLVQTFGDNNSLLIVDDIIGINAAADALDALIDEREERCNQDGIFTPHRQTLYLTANELLDQIHSRNPWQYDPLSSPDDDVEVENHSIVTHQQLTTAIRSKSGSGDALAPLERQLNQWRGSGDRVAFVVGSHLRAERLQKLLLDLGWDIPFLDSHSFSDWHKSSQHPIAILKGTLRKGFRSQDQKLVILSESDIFSERSYRTKGQKAQNLKKLMGSLSQLKESDYVVHVDYGIGVYKGLEHREVGGSGADLLKIEYADSLLLLPVHNISKIQKFSAAEGQVPTVDKLSSQRWQKTKEKVRKNVVSIAGDLIKLYASRSVAKGWAFDAYGAEDERFADDFPYDETEDQLQAIHETIADMSSERPMDRLICGDVGFGKTEVALRAAYKCSQHGRQTAVLAPTTILVEQHKQTFLKRFAEYPIKVGALSRFYKPAENKRAIELLEQGDLDIVIGTHKLLQKDVDFKDLGLLIIDEEHRFGVKQKERLKQLRKQVDVLTLTATPIPRTLHMSLLEIRDISLITTPPTDRRSVRTYTANWDENLIRDAILRELQRGGQSFYVHNRVVGIETICAELQELVPEARFQFAHGQMKESQLEKIMLAFMNHEIDVLVCTTIIESGIDIPNANTMIINRANMFGLAQLYQLRGRVGRSDRQAYCYFLVPQKRKLGAEALQRLKALQSLDDLGQGFHLALRDLEIRGAGNLLGKEQSGSVAAVGFELYTKILKEAVQHLRGDEPDPEIDPELSVTADAYIPEAYIPDISERLILYQRLAGLVDEDEAQALTEEIEDRFGVFGAEVTNLIDLMTFRAVLRRHGVIKADITSLKTSLSFHPQANLDLEALLAIVRSNTDKYRFTKNLTLSLSHSENTPLHTIYRDICSLLRGIQKS